MRAKRVLQLLLVFAALILAVAEYGAVRNVIQHPTMDGYRFALVFPVFFLSVVLIATLAFRWECRETMKLLISQLGMQSECLNCGEGLLNGGD
jgi:hypothetical protein